jgi:hypothetical protein
LISADLKTQREKRTQNRKGFFSFVIFCIISIPNQTSPASETKTKMESGPSVTLDPYDEDFKKVPILSLFGCGKFISSEFCPSSAGDFCR